MVDAPRNGDEGTRSGAGSPKPAARRSRLATAAWDFLIALKSDLLAVKEWLARPLPAIHAWHARRALPPLATSEPAAWAHAAKQVLRRLAPALVLAIVAGTFFVSGGMLWALRGVPFNRTIGKPGPTLLVEAANGEPLGRIGPLRVADVPLQHFPAILVKAVLSIEDHRFYYHFGIDPIGILRAAHENMMAGKIVEGGSTITQQYVKLRYLNNDRTYVRKLREALLAIWLESRMSKNEILTRYLNAVYMGDGAYGIPAAAELYFGKPPSKLTLAEAAMLAGMIKAPSQFNPLWHLKQAQARAAQVLNAMVAYGAIDAQAANAAKADPATVKPSPRLAQARSWFTDWLAKRAPKILDLHAGSLRVRTTLRPDLQRLAQSTLDGVLATQGRRRHASQGALVAMRPDGAVVAMVGGRNYDTSQFNRAVDAARQPGSAFKLFVYLAALRAGYSPRDIVDAGPVDIKGWQPQNYDDEHYGRITLAEAFARSVNTAAVRLAMNVGLNKVIAAARDLGITTPLQPLPSLALGAVDVNLLDLTGAFASVRADRMHVKPWGIAAVGPANGSSLRASGPPRLSGATLDPYQQPLVELLRDVVEHGTGRRAALNGAAAGKTGTSQDYRDAWFIGFDDSLIVGVWVGNDNDSPMKRVVGGSLPAEIWRRFMIQATPLMQRPNPLIAATPTPAAIPATNGSAPHDDRQTALDQAAQALNAPTPPGYCDIQACSSAYASFRASDCTYQPYSGPRQLCTIGAPRSQSTVAAAATVGSGSSPAHCDVAVCAQHYNSFNAADCTYQPYDGGPRQICKK